MDNGKATTMSDDDEVKPDDHASDLAAGRSAGVEAAVYEAMEYCKKMQVVAASWQESAQTDQRRSDWRYAKHKWRAATSYLRVALEYIEEAVGAVEQDCETADAG